MDFIRHMRRSAFFPGRWGFGQSLVGHRSAGLAVPGGRWLPDSGWKSAIMPLETKNSRQESRIRSAYCSGGISLRMQARTSGQAGSSIVFPALRQSSIRYCGLQPPAAHGAGAGFPCG